MSSTKRKSAKAISQGDLNLTLVNRRRKKQLAEYLSVVDDPFIKGIFRTLCKGINLDGTEARRVDDLLDGVDLSLLTVNKLLGEDINPTNKLEKLIEAVTLAMQSSTKEAYRVGWDRDFICGESGSDLLNQFRSRGGWLSDKQTQHLMRIAHQLSVSVEGINGN